MALFTVGDLNFVSTIVSDECFTPSRPWERRGVKKEDLPRVQVGQDQHELRDYPVAKYSAEWWFVYFFDQAKGGIARLKTPAKNALLALFNAAFLRPDSLRQDMEGQRYVIPRGPLVNVPTHVLRDGLLALLAAGFEYIEMGANGVQVSSEVLRTYALNVDRRNNYHLVWRGGEREWNNVRAYGYAAAARYEADAIAWNMRQPWHPFNDPNIRSRVYYRNAYTDNCLFTVVSVTDEWQCALCYPKIEQTTELMTIQGRVKAGASLQALQAQFPGRIARVTYTDGRSDYRIVNVTRIALMVLEGLVLDTQQRQKDTRGATDYYPEQGAQSIVGSNVMAMVEYVRVFHGVEDREGFTAFQRPSGAHVVSMGEMAVAFGDARGLSDYYSKVLSEFSSARVNRTSLRWEATGAGTPPGPAIGYWREIRFGDGTTLKR